MGWILAIETLRQRDRGRRPKWRTAIVTRRVRIGEDWLSMRAVGGIVARDGC